MGRLLSVVVFVKGVYRGACEGVASPVHLGRGSNVGGGARNRSASVGSLTLSGPFSRWLLEVRLEAWCHLPGYCRRFLVRRRSRRVTRLSR